MSRCRAKTKKCPDNIKRSGQEIADFLGMTKSNWYTRVRNHGFEKAWAMGRRWNWNRRDIDNELPVNFKGASRS